MAADLAAARLPYERLHIAPTLLNNVLWSIVVDQGDTLLTGQLGLFDEPFALPTDRARLRRIARRDDLLAPIRDERAVRVITWFSRGFYAVSPGAGDTLRLVDLRFGSLPGRERESVFAFQVYPRRAGEEWGLRQTAVRDVDFAEAFGALWERLGGRADGAGE